jgi:hypothetical protein
MTSSSNPARIALVAMPWSAKDRPSAALGALAPYCMEIRDRRSIAERFDLDARRVDELVAPFLEHRLMFAEGAKCLSLAVATDPLVAARRIAHSS